MVTMCLDDEGMGCCSPKGAGHEIHRPEGGRETQQGNHHQVWIEEILMIQGLNLCENILHVTNMGNLGKNKFSFVTEIGFKMRRKITKKLRLFRENIFEKPISSRTVFQIDDGESDEFFSYIYISSMLITELLSANDFF